MSGWGLSRSTEAIGEGLARRWSESNGLGEPTRVLGKGAIYIPQFRGSILDVTEETEKIPEPRHPLDDIFKNL